MHHTLINSKLNSHIKQQSHLHKMSFRLLLLILVLIWTFSIAFEGKTTLRAALSNSQIDILKGHILRYIEKNFTDVTVPGFDEDLFFFRIRAVKNQIHVNQVQPNQLRFSLLNGTNDFLMYANGLSAQGRSNVTIRLLFITHKCELQIVCKNASFVARIGVRVNGTRLAVAIKSMVYELSPDNIEISLYGDTVDNLLSALVRMRKRFFISEMKRCMLRILPEVITEIFNEILQEIPDDMTDGSGAFAKLAITESPFILENYMVGSVFAFVHQEGERNPPEYSIKELPRFNRECKKGAQIFVSDYLVRTALETAQKVGLLKIDLTLNVLGSTIDLSCYTPNTPVAIFNTTVKTDATAKCRVKVRNNLAEIEFGITAGGKAELKEWVKDSMIYFRLSKAHLNTLVVDIGINISLKILLPVVNVLAKMLLPTVNEVIGAKGIPMPEIPYFELVDVDQDIIGEYISVCTTLVPKFEQHVNKKVSALVSEQDLVAIYNTILCSISINCLQHLHTSVLPHFQYVQFEGEQHFPLCTFLRSLAYAFRSILLFAPSLCFYFIVLLQTRLTD
eukprot:TRINITY_DN105309_c0_g1_i1.p1 TRINITY_DN105309_c0_g1~~TRINITY_DN105309_c0_g1_i1.p1  ORF type:complete len:573 (-),score=15.29 TRINITY_DN105309_c0_g1_i1:3023-4711(-)